MLAALALACRPAAPAPSPRSAALPPATGAPLLDRPLSAVEERWVETTLASLGVRQKAAQLVFVRAYGRYLHPRSPERRRLVAEVAELEVGGVVLFASELESIPPLLDDLQAAAPVPLLVASDLERGMAFRVARGTVPLPYAMAVGATGSAAAARFTGEVTAREARALGIHWALAPVADVNNNPANPVINLRSYGEDPQRVGELAAAFVEGARAGGLMTAVKHFPGHGDTATDSHRDLPVLGFDRERLAAVEWVPFRRAIAAGADAVMLGHVAVPALDPSGAPATLSPILTSELLRGELGFEGLIVTDALEMAGLRPAWTGETAVEAVAAGADVLLLPGEPGVAIAELERAVADGRITEGRLDASVRRLLVAKARLGLDRRRTVDPAALEWAVARPEDLERAAEIAAASITVVRNEGGVLPLAAETPLRLLHLVVSSDPGDRDVRALPERALRARGITYESRRLGAEVSAETAEELLAAAPAFSHILVSAFVRVDSEGATALSPSQRRLLDRLAALSGGGRDPPLIVLSFGSPYLLGALPPVPVYVATYGAPPTSQRAAMAALFGEAAITGKLPVTLPGLYPRGHGLELPRRAMTLEPVARRDAAAAGFRPEGLADLDRLLDDLVAGGAFPGGVLAVGYRGRLHLRPFGRLADDAGAPPVTAGSIYDLASLTKVVATTTMAMILVDEGRLVLDKPVADYLPRFAGGGKEAVTVRQLLTHSSGIDWWAPLYEELAGKKAYVERILGLPLAYEPGTETVYSDLGVILLGEILERVAGEPLDIFVERRVFAPLGMDETGFLPDPALVPRIAPTEEDPWRGRLLRGEVHDENAFALGGVAPHAGLFSTAGDLARFVQMLVWGGVYGHHRIVARETVERFTRPAGDVAGSTRALGWDTKSPRGSSAGTLFSPQSFGHTGFTGTSIWIDPARELFVVLLTNRVHPTRENRLIREARPAIHDAVIRSLAEPGLASAAARARSDDDPAPAAAAAMAPVLVGLDRIAAGETHGLVGKRLGLLVHAASVTAGGHHAIDVFAERGLEVVRLFSPEHGLAGRAAAGESVAHGHDPATGLPVVSLYGERRKPTPADLAGLDALVVDLQGAGVRFYTYVSTLLLCLEAAAEAEIELVVLDRPNPLGGERIEGPVAAPRDQVVASFVNLAPGPLVHGLTLGEMARWVNARRDRPARLALVPMTGWRRAMTWAETGRSWVPPSPNLRSAEAAVAYPGVALIEATNVSEGRGTEAPFLRLGAPGLDPAALTGIAVPGFALAPVRFTPRGSPAALHPKHEGRECAGVALRVTDPEAAEPYRLGLELLARLSRQDGFAWRSNALTHLVGTPRVLAALRAGSSVDEILAADRADHAAWRQARRDALLYR